MVVDCCLCGCVKVSVLLFVWGFGGCLTCYCVLHYVCCSVVIYFINALCDCLIVCLMVCLRFVLFIWYCLI